MVHYYAVIRSETFGADRYTVWGPASPSAIDELCAAAESAGKDVGSSVRVEVALSGTGKTAIAGELIRRLGGQPFIRLIVR
jgi:hypothetical protein